VGVLSRYLGHVEVIGGELGLFGFLGGHSLWRSCGCGLADLDQKLLRVTASL
jgi:hypothetical protein